MVSVGSKASTSTGSASTEPSSSSSSSLAQGEKTRYAVPSPRVWSMLGALLASAATMGSLSTVSAQTTQAQDVRLVPLTSTDQGNGIHSVSFNSPYTSVRQSIAPGYSSARLNFEATPQIPTGATLQSFSWTHNDSGDYKLPSWLSFVQSWSPDSSNFVLNLNGTDHLAANKKTDMAIVDLVGSVVYSHGPARYLETEARSARLIVHMQTKLEVEERAAVTTHFNRKADTSNGYKVFENKAANALIPSFTVETGELYSLNCGTTEETGCAIGTANSSDGTAFPIWSDQYSEIAVKSGVTRITAPMALYGARLEVAAGSKLIFDGSTATSAFSLMSSSRVTTFVNNGEVIVRKGVLRLLGTSMAGAGKITVEEGATLEIDADQEVNLGDSPASGVKKTLIRNKGKVVFVSGNTRLTGAIVSTGVGIVTVGMAAKVTLAGAAPHILGGLYDGSAAVTSPNGLNAVGAIINGALSVETGASLLVAAGVRVQGLGSMTIAQGAAMQVSIEFYDPINFPDAAIIATGPATERVLPGLTNRGTIMVEKGGMKLATGIANRDAGAIEIGEKGYLHFTSGTAENSLKGAYLANRGDISLVSDAKVVFELAVQSYSCIKGYTAGTAMVFSGPTSSVLTRPAGSRVGTAASSSAGHLFALFTAGSVLVKDSAKLRLVSPPGETSDKEVARFYAAVVQNAGGLEVDTGASLETTNFAQNFQVSTVAEPLQTHAVPYTALAGEGSKLSSILAKKYTISAATGLISQADPASLTGSSAGTKAAFEVIAGHVGGVNGSSFDGALKLGPKAVLAPGSSFPTERVLPSGEYASGSETWKAVAKATRSPGRVIAKSLKLSEGTAVSLEVLSLAAAGTGYDQVDIAGEVDITGAILTVTTSFDALAYAASSIETFSLAARGRHASVASVGGDMGQLAVSGIAGMAPSRRVARTQALTVAEQSYDGAPVAFTGGNTTTMQTLMQTTELFRLPIITSGGLPAGQKFTKVNVNWIPTEAGKEGRFTTLALDSQKASGINQELFGSLRNTLGAHVRKMETMAETRVNGEVVTTSTQDLGPRKIEGQVHVAIEYSGGNVMLVGYQDKDNVSGASMAATASAIGLVFAAVILAFVF